MTTAEMVAELKAALGNRTDILDSRYALWLNFGLYDLCGFHRKRQFDPPRFHELEGELLFSTEIVAGSFIAPITTTQFVIDALLNQVDSYYTDMIVEITGYTGTAPSGLVGQKSRITAYMSATNTITISTAWTVTPDINTQFTISRREIDIFEVTGLALKYIYAIERIENADTGAPVVQVDWTELIGLDRTTIGVPTRFARHAGKLVFDQTPDVVAPYRMYYYKLPTALDPTNSPNVENELPVNWQEIVILAAVWRGFDRLFEPDRAGDARAKYIDSAINHRDAKSLEVPNTSRGLKMRSQ